MSFQAARRDHAGEAIERVIRDVRSRPIFERLLRRRRLRVLSKAFGEALKESRAASTWPGEQLAVSLEIAERVEHIAQQIHRETRPNRSPH